MMSGRRRDDFLKTVRIGAARAVPPHAHETDRVTGEVGRMRDERPLADVFAARAEGADMRVSRVHTTSEAAARIAEIIRQEEITHVMTWATPLFDELDLETALAGISVEEWDPALPEEARKARAFAMTCGITGVDYAVAETGSLVLASAPKKGRSVSLLGRVHVAVLRADQILPDLYDLPARLAADFPRGLPGNLTLITGPSKTADIELHLIIGVHGPAVVYVVLIEP